MTFCLCDAKNPCDAILEKSDNISSLISLSNSQRFFVYDPLKGNSDFTHQSLQFTGLGEDHCMYEKSSIKPFEAPQGADKLREI